MRRMCAASSARSPVPQRLERWMPRDLQHPFVSIMSADGVPVEEIARLAGHNRTATTSGTFAHAARTAELSQPSRYALLEHALPARDPAELGRDHRASIAQRAGIGWRGAATGRRQVS